MESTGSDRVRVISLVQGSPDEVVIDRITERTGTEGMSISFVSFPPGTRRPWSSHDQDQYVWTLGGRGVIASEEGDIARARDDDLHTCPPKASTRGR